MAKARTRVAKATCANCFFGRNLLCALSLEEPCVSFRPDGPDGLCPPRQLRFAFRAERSVRATWAFPSAQEQAVIHAR